MGRNKCVAFKCPNTPANRPDLRFHQIPKDRWVAWVEALQNPHLQYLPSTSRHVVWSAHFTDSDFNGSRKRSRLKHHAVPSLEMSSSTPAALIVQPSMDQCDSNVGLNSLDGDADDVMCQEEEQEIHSLLKQDTADGIRAGLQHSHYITQPSSDHDYASPPSPEGLQLLDVSPAATSTPLPSQSPPPPDVLCPPSKRRHGKIPHEVIRVPRKERTPLVNKLLKCARRSRVEAITLRNKYLKKCEEVRRLRSKTEEEALALHHDKVHPRFFKLLQAEVRNYTRKPQARRWTDEEKAELETIRQRGPRAFRGFPITKPTRKTLKQPWRDLNLRPGLNRHILELLRRRAATMTPEERVCYVVFDEMSLRVHLFLILNQDRVDGFVDLGSGDRRPRLAEEVMVAMIRSIYGKWKMPVAYWFTDKGATAWEFHTLFKTTITALLQAGFDVRAIVTDGLQKNLSAQHLLGASHEQPFFTIMEKKIVTIADVPHLLKSLRNALLKHLLLRPDGTLVDIKFIRAFALQDIQMQPRLAPKLTKRHLEPNNFEKMNVKLAGQLLSASTAAGVMTYSFLGLLPQEAMATGRFCEDVNNFVDSFNGIENVEQPDQQNFKCALNNASAHLQLWDNMLNDMDGWEFLGGDRVAVIKNWKITIRAFKILWNNLQADGYTYLPTGHVNQDCLENLFMGIRYHGGNRSNPSAEDFQSAFMRSFVKNITTESKGKNCRDDEAVNLVSMKELLNILQHSKAQEQMVEEPGPSSLEDNDSGILILDDDEAEAETDDNSNSILQETSSSRVAAPLVKAFLHKLNCAECAEHLQTEASFPLHLHHTMTASDSNTSQLLPTKQVADVVKDIYAVCRRQMKFELHLANVIHRFKRVLPHLPACRSLSLCSAHANYKERFLVDIAVLALNDTIASLNKDFRDRAKRVQPDPQMSTK